MSNLVSIEVDDVTLQVRVWAAASPSQPPVMLLHATGKTAEDWADVAAALSPSRTVYALNLRGHGPSGRQGPT